MILNHPRAFGFATFSPCDLLSSFINDTDRIANRDYQPTDDDVIRARLRTLGVQEYRFIFDHGIGTLTINFNTVSDVFLLFQDELWARSGDYMTLAERGAVSVFSFQTFSSELFPDGGDSGQRGTPTLTMVSFCSLVTPLPSADSYYS